MNMSICNYCSLRAIQDRYRKRHPMGRLEQMREGIGIALYVVPLHWKKTILMIPPASRGRYLVAIFNEVPDRCVCNGD